jgi:hypothetical protein
MAPEIEKEWTMTGGELAFLALVVVGMLFFSINLAAVTRYTNGGK